MTPFTKAPDAVDAAHTGAEWLDQNKPGWVDHINVDTLDMSRSESCILGQLYGDYWTAPAVHPDLYHYEDRARLGFTVGLPDVWRSNAWVTLAEAWKAEIYQRRGVAV